MINIRINSFFASLVAFIAVSILIVLIVVFFVKRDNKYCTIKIIRDNSDYDCEEKVTKKRVFVIFSVLTLFIFPLWSVSKNKDLKENEENE